MTAEDKTLEALFQEAVSGQERLEEEATSDSETLPIEEEDGTDDDDEEEFEVPAADEAEAAFETLPADAISEIAEAAPPKRTAQDAITEALIKAKQEALDALEQTQTEAKSMQERLLRVSADFDNFRKRSRKQQEDAVKFANESLLRDLLPVIDNFDRAIEHGQNEAETPFVQGVKMVHQHLVSTLSRFDVTPFSALGQAFDPTHHEAVEQEITSEHAPGQVVREYQKGYMLADRLLRPAMVVVAKAPAEGAVATPAPAATSEAAEPEGDSVPEAAAAEATDGAAAEAAATSEPEAAAEPTAAADPGAAEATGGDAAAATDEAATGDESNEDTNQA